MKEFEYKKIADELEACVRYAMGLRVKMENPNGKKETFRIGNISISILGYQSRSTAINNGISGDIIDISPLANMKVKVWIKNDVKVARTDFSYNDILVDPIYIKMFFRGIIHSIIKRAVNEFFTQKLKDNKYSLWGEKPGTRDDTVPNPLEEFTPEGLKAIENLTRTLYKKSNILSASSAIAINRKLWFVCDSLGTKVVQIQDSTVISVTFEYLSNKKILIDDHFTDYFKTFKELTDSLKKLEIKLEKKLAKLEMKRIESGIHPILLKPSAVATLFHEAVAGHMLSAKYILNGQSTVFEKKLGKRLANKELIPILDEISIYDTPSNTNMMAHYQYDMEGSPAKDVCLVDRGIVKNYLTDKNTAFRLKQESNGHYLSGSYTAVQKGVIVGISPEPRISNMVIKSHSNVSLEEIKEMIFEEFDWYLEVDSRSGQVSIETGTFDLLTSSVTKIYRDGRREAIYPGVLSSNMTDFLAAIKVVSNHNGESKGVCGSESGYVPTHGIAPAMMLYGINFITSPKQEKFTEIDPKRDKFIPEDF